MLRPLNHLVRAGCASAPPSVAGPRIPLPAFARPLAALAKPRDPEKPLMLGEERNFSLPFQISSNFYQFPQAGEKAKYEEPAQALKAKYSEAMKSYKESGKQDAWKRDPERPKKPLTPFFKFMEERQRAAAGNPKEVVEITKSAGLKWKSLSESEKSRYAAGWAEAKEKYAAELQAYKDSSEVGITALKEKMQAKKVAAKARTQKAKDANKAKLQKAKAVEKAKKAKETEKAKKAKEAEKAKADR
eukprot:g15058.t1